MWWPWRRRAASEPTAPLADDEVARRLRELAEHWRRDPGVRPWEDLVDAAGHSPAGEALAGPTMLLPTAGPLLTPAQRWRGRVGRS